MINPDLQKQFDLLNANLVAIKTKNNPGIWRSFFNGMFAAFGYLVGVVMVVVIVGWILTTTGLIKPFQVQWQKFQNFMYQAENTMSASQGQQGSSQTYTLPDGRRVQVVPAQ